MWELQRPEIKLEMEDDANDIKEKHWCLNQLKKTIERLLETTYCRTFAIIESK